MFKKIVHTADWHLHTSKYHQRFIDTKNEFLKSIKEKTEGYKPEEVLVSINGDLFHNEAKKQSNEAFDLMQKTLKEISDVYKTIVFIGNHDYDKANKSNMDCITPIANSFIIQGNTNLTFLKHSQHYELDNLMIFNYSNFDNNTPPDVKNIKKMYPNKTYIGMFHDVIQGAKNFDNIDVSLYDNTVLNPSIFEGCDFVLMGDIHKHQEIANNIPTVYCGSLMQLNYGESVEGHGYCLWDIENKSYEFIELQSDWGMYKFEINSYDDIINNNEKLLNLK